MMRYALASVIRLEKIWLRDLDLVLVPNTISNTNHAFYLLFFLIKNQESRSDIVTT